MTKQEIGEMFILFIFGAFVYFLPELIAFEIRSSIKKEQQKEQKNEQASCCKQ